MSKMLNLTLKVWRQEGPDQPGRFETYTTTVADDASFLEMLDYVNEDLIANDQEPIAFDHDCREGICGSCGVMIDGQAHGPQKGTATCQLHMRKFDDGAQVTIEPWRAAGFPIIRDLSVNRAAFDRIIEAGGYISVSTGAAPEANMVPVPKDAADAAMDAAACIGCGACVAACPNSAANLFIHGGYWRRFSARDHVFLAPALVQAGLCAVFVNYELWPTVRMEEIVRQVRGAIAWAYQHGAEFGADPGRLTISGHSAGGHLVAMALQTDWPGVYGLPTDVIKGAVAISGLFDLGFVPYSYVQPKVQASWDQVRRLSPIDYLPDSAPPLLVAVGDAETGEFRRQSRDFLAAWQAKGLRGSWLEPAGKHHLAVLEELEDPSSALHRALVATAKAA